MCRPKKESGTGSLGGTSFAARALLFHNSTEIAARTSNAKRRKADLGAVDMLRVLLSNGGVSFGSLPPSGVWGSRSAAPRAASDGLGWEVVEKPVSALAREVCPEAAAGNS